MGRNKKYKPARISHWGKRDAIKDIARLFVIPCLKSFVDVDAEQQPNSLQLAEMFFGSAFRDVYFAKATKKFTLPGDLIERGNKTISGVGLRTVNKNKTVIVRDDQRESFVKVEVQRDRRQEKFYVTEFKMTRAEFNAIKRYLRRVK